MCNNRESHPYLLQKFAIVLFGRLPKSVIIKQKHGHYKNQQFLKYISQETVIETIDVILFCNVGKLPFFFDL